METDERFFWVASDVAEKHRLQAERRAIAKARYNTRHAADKRNHHRAPMATREFVVWDGEGPQDTAYSLLGNSEGDELCYPTLKTEDCLRFLIQCSEKYPDTIHVSYGFDYDVSNILRDLPWRCFAALHKFNRTVWRGYQIEHIPHKWFKVVYGHISIRIFDVHSFFGKPLIGALEEWSIGPWNASINESAPMLCAATGGLSISHSAIPTIDIVRSLTEKQLVELFKSLRSEFLWSDIEQIAIYMRLELKYMKQLMGALRDSLHRIGYSIRSWHGPGALANAAIRRHSIRDCFGNSPSHIADAARFAFVAGRFEGVWEGESDVSTVRISIQLTPITARNFLIWLMAYGDRSLLTSPEGSEFIALLTKHMDRTPTDSILCLTVTLEEMSRGQIGSQAGTGIQKPI